MNEALRSQQELALCPRPESDFSDTLDCELTATIRPPCSEDYQDHVRSNAPSTWAKEGIPSWELMHKLTSKIGRLVRNVTGTLSDLMRPYPWAEKAHEHSAAVFRFGNVYSLQFCNRFLLYN